MALNLARNSELTKDAISSSFVQKHSYHQRINIIKQPIFNERNENPVDLDDYVSVSKKLPTISKMKLGRNTPMINVKELDDHDDNET